MQDDNTPQSAGGGNTKLVAAGLLLLVGGGGAIYALTRPGPQPQAPTAPTVVDAGSPAPRAVPLVAPAIELPPEEPDAGPPVDAGGPRIRYVTRYVGACNGTFANPNGVSATAQANYGALRACYEHELRANQQLRGRLTATLKISTAGHADEVSVSTAMHSTALVQCIKRSLQRLSYPSPRGGCAIARVSFNFSPRE